MVLKKKKVENLKASLARIVVVLDLRGSVCVCVRESKKRKDVFYSRFPW